MVALLKAQRAAQAAERLHAGERWADSGLVFTTEFGGPVDPRNVLRTIELAAEKAGIKKPAERASCSPSLRCCSKGGPDHACGGVSPAPLAGCWSGGGETGSRPKSSWSVTPR
jgi:hypothetical protein